MSRMGLRCLRGRVCGILVILGLIQAFGLLGVSANAAEKLASHFPNPRKYPSRCGRGSVAFSFVCDPWDILGREIQDRIDMVARSVDSHGPKFGVAVMKTVGTGPTWGCGQEAQAAAKEIVTAWKFDGLVLYSADDKQFCIAQSGTVEQYPKEKVEQIYSEVKRIMQASATAGVEAADQVISMALIRAGAVASSEGTGTSLGKIPKPTGMQLMQTFIAHCIPFIGFGITDNGLMIIFGEAIEQFLGKSMGLSTMGAAATGNLLSDIAGIFLGGQVQTMASKFGAHEPDLTNDQRRLNSYRYTKMVGESVGISIGCWIGMAPLLFVEHEEDMDIEVEGRAFHLPHVQSLTRFDA